MYIFKRVVFIFVLFLFVGCGNGGGAGDFKNSSPTLVDTNCTDPYLKFKPILNKAMLQCPTSKDNSCGTDYGDFEGFSNKYFYYKGCDLVFHMCGDHNRSELRFQDEFYVSDEVNKSLEVIVKPIPNTDELTFLQLHGVHTGINKPVLRAIIYKGKLKLFVFNGENYIKKDLGKYSPHFMKFRIIAGYSKLYVYKDGKLEINATINYPDKCYYKLGAYLQRSGCGDSEFNYIKINF